MVDWLWCYFGITRTIKLLLKNAELPNCDWCWLYLDKIELILRVYGWHSAVLISTLCGDDDDDNDDSRALKLHCKVVNTRAAHRKTPSAKTRTTTLKRYRHTLTQTISHAHAHTQNRKCLGVCKPNSKSPLCELKSLWLSVRSPLALAHAHALFAFRSWFRDFLCQRQQQQTQQQQRQPVPLLLCSSYSPSNSTYPLEGPQRWTHRTELKTQVRLGCIHHGDKRAVCARSFNEPSIFKFHYHTLSPFFAL